VSFLRRDTGSHEGAGSASGPKDIPARSSELVPARSKEAPANGTAQRAAAQSALAKRSQAGPQPTERQQRAAARATRTQEVREARKAVGGMEPPEPRFGLYVAAALVGAALISLFNTDVEDVAKKVHGKTVTVSQVVPHSQVVVVVSGVLLLTLGSAATIYWRRRMVTMMAFMLTAIFAISLPLPQSMADLRWVIYLVPLGYAAWMFFRQNKAQKLLLSKRTTSAGPSGASSNGAGRQGGQASRQAAPRSRKKDTGKQVVGATGRALPADNRRYTRPQAKARAGQRKR
jgi:hypothetical protein